MGRIVTAMTYPDGDRETPAQEMTGELTESPVESLGYTQCFVDGVLVDPATVREVKAGD